MIGIVPTGEQTGHIVDRAAQPTITVHPASTPDENLPGNGVVIDKRHVRMVVSP
jgi:hypothetical protein